MSSASTDSEFANLTPLKIAEMTASHIRDGAKLYLDPLHLNEIPGAMRKMGWLVSAQLMERWFATAPAYSMDPDIRKGEWAVGHPIDYRKLPATQVEAKIVKMDWVLGFSRAAEVVEELAQNWNSPAGIDRLKNKLLGPQGWMVGKNMKLGYGLRSAQELEFYCYVNSRLVGEVQDVLDDFYGAIFKATMKVAVRGKTRRFWGSDLDVFEVDKLGLYLRDTYDFNGDSYLENMQGLGVWSRTRMLNKAEFVDYKTSTWAGKAIRYQGFVPVLNRNFREWQDKNKSGGDYFVFSDVLWIDSKVDHVVL